MKHECEGCGAPLILHRRDCEYCRRVHSQPRERQPLNGYDSNTQQLYVDGVAHPYDYWQGWSDPRGVYGNDQSLYNQQALMNSQGQAAASYYNQQNSMAGLNQSPLSQLGALGASLFGRGW